MELIYSSIIEIIKNTTLTQETSLDSSVNLDGRFLTLSNYPIVSIIPLIQLLLENDRIEKSKPLIFKPSYNHFTIEEILNKDFDFDSYEKISEFEINTSFKCLESAQVLFQVYQNETEFFEACKRAKKHDPKSKFPLDFYLIDEDYHQSKDSDTGRYPKIQQIYRIENFIDALEKIADFQDTKNGTVLYFRATEKQGHICDLQVNYSELLSQELTNIKISEDAYTLIGQIQSLDINRSIADKERKFIFSSTFSEFLHNKEGDRLLYLIKHWDEFDNLFNKNFQVYPQGKSINELKVALAEEQIKLSDNITKGVIDILSKVLILPTISAVFLIFRQSILSSSHSGLITIIFGVLICIVAVATYATASIHYRVVEALEYSSKFVNKDIKKDLLEGSTRNKQPSTKEDEKNIEVDSEFTNLHDKLNSIIDNTKCLLSCAKWGIIILTIMSIMFLAYLFYNEDKLHSGAQYYPLYTDIIHLGESSFFAHDSLFNNTLKYSSNIDALNNEIQISSPTPNSESPHEVP